MIDPLAMQKRPDNFLQRQRAADVRAEDANRFLLTRAAGDERYVKRQGGGTAARPLSPVTYEMYFDIDLGIPIWYDGTNWVDATGATV